MHTCSGTMHTEAYLLQPPNHSFAVTAPSATCGFASLAYITTTSITLSSEERQVYTSEPKAQQHRTWRRQKACTPALRQHVHMLTTTEVQCPHLKVPGSLNTCSNIVYTIVQPWLKSSSIAPGGAKKPAPAAASRPGHRARWPPHTSLPQSPE